MKINDVLGCFTKVLEEKGILNKRFIGYSKWERRIGAVKTAYTTISLIENNSKSEDIIKAEYTASVPTGQEEILIMESEKKALIEFIKWWYNDTGIEQ